MSIYTKTGDKGTTHLASGEVVAKSSVRIDTYGSIDELNAYSGLLRDVLVFADEEQFDTLISQLKEIQNDLFDVCSELAIAGEETGEIQIVTKESVKRLESEIDKYNEGLPTLKNFVIPGGHVGNSYAHVVRTISRRAERLVVKLSEEEPVRAEVLMYVNRLSDWFFVASRVISKTLNCSEILWNKRAK